MHILCVPSLRSLRSVSHSFSEGWLSAVPVLFNAKTPVTQRPRKVQTLFLTFEF